MSGEARSPGLKWSVHKYLAVLWIDLRQQLAYRGEFLLGGVMIAIFMFIFVSLWRTVYSISGESEIEGFRLSQVVWYLAMTETVILSGSRIFDEISAAVKSGDLAYTLIRPYSYVGYQIAHSLGLTYPRMLRNFLVASAVILPFVRRVETSGQGVLGFLVLALMGSLTG